jgi:hypothetical protein
MMGRSLLLLRDKLRAIRTLRPDGMLSVFQATLKSSEWSDIDSIYHKRLSPRSDPRRGRRGAFLVQA